MTTTATDTSVIPPADSWAAPYAEHPLSATVTIPGSKSLSNRYLILAALGSRPTTIHGLLRSRDTELMMQALRTLGVQCDMRADDPTVVRVSPPHDGRLTGNATVDCGLAGTVMRFVPPLALLADGPVRFDGDEQSYARPMQPLLDALEQLGADISYHRQPGHLPLTITRHTGRDDVMASHRRAAIRIDSSTSSQFISGLLLFGSRLPAGLQLTHVGGRLPSMPHIRMTMRDIEISGGSVMMTKRGQWVVDHGDLQLPNGIVVEPDLSNAVPFLAAALIAGGTVSIPRWPYHTTQPGGMAPGILRDMGGQVTLDGRPFPTKEPGSIAPSNIDAAQDENPQVPADADLAQESSRTGMLRVSSGNGLHGLGRYDLSAAGEIAPSIAALAVFADSPTTLVGIGHLRGHETNRLRALVNEIRRIGADTEELPDGLAIRPVPRTDLHGCVMRTYADHRMATFAAMIGLGVPDTKVMDIATTRKTLPDFPGLWHAMLHAAD